MKFWCIFVIVLSLHSINCLAQVRINNLTHYQVEERIYDYTAILFIDSVLIKFIYAPTSSHVNKSKIYFINDHFFIIELERNLRRSSLKYILFHELIHIKQFKEGALMIIDDDIYWYGNKYFVENWNYYSLPWELEANFLTLCLLTKNFFPLYQHDKKKNHSNHNAIAGLVDR